MGPDKVDGPVASVSLTRLLAAHSLFPMVPWDFKIATRDRCSLTLNVLVLLFLFSVQFIVDHSRSPLLKPSRLDSCLPAGSDRKGPCAHAVPPGTCCVSEPQSGPPTVHLAL